MFTGKGNFSIIEIQYRKSSLIERTLYELQNRKDSDYHIPPASAGCIFSYTGRGTGFSYTHIHREGSSTAVSESRTETREKSSKTTTHSDVSVDFPSAPSAGGMVYPYLTKNKLPSASVLRDSGSAYEYGVLAAVKGEKGWGLLGRKGEEVVPPVYSSISYEGDGLFRVKGKKGFSYITADGNPAAPPREEGTSFYRGKGKYGILDEDGKG